LATKEIDELLAATSFEDGDLLHIKQGGVDKHLSKADFLTSIADLIANVAKVERTTATAGQTVFSTTVEYPAGTNALMVVVDGAVKKYGVDYNEPSNTAFVFTTPMTGGEQVDAWIGTIVTTTGGGGSGTTTASTIGIELFAQTISENFSIPVGKNAISVNPTVADGVVVTVESGSEWLILGS